MKNLWRRFSDAARLWQDESGQTCNESGQAYIEVLVLMPVFLVLIVGAAYFGRAWYVKVAAEVAAYDGTRTAIEAMNENPHGYMPGGRLQGIIAARRTLAGFYLDPSAADVRVTPMGVWDRGEAVRCDVRYSVDLSGVPGLGLISADPVLPVWARTVGQVEAYKSEW